MPNYPPTRKKMIASPEELAKRFDEYVEWAHSVPWMKNEAIKSGPNAGTIIRIPHERPLTLWDFAAYLGLSYRGLENYGSMEGYESYFPVYARIKTEMSAQRISGGLADVYNAGLVARIDGIVEKSAIEHSGSVDLSAALTEARKRAGL